MPVQYEGIRQEHVAVRTGAGMFDVSHMGEIETSGPQAEELLQRLLSNDVTKIAERGAQYSVLCREDGGVLDDLFTYRLGPDRFLTVTNASNHEKDLAWFREHTGDFDAEVTDAHERWAMLAVQGPDARAAVERVAEGELPARMRTAEVSIAGVECLACGTGYTGEDGVELLIPPEGAVEVWDALLEQGVVPAGLGARDTLRLEVCFHLYGNDLSEDRNPIEAGLGMVLQARHRLHRRGRAARDRAGPDARAVRVHGRRDPAPGQPCAHRDRRARGAREHPFSRRGSRDQRLAVTVPGGGHRDGIRAGGRRGAWHRVGGGRARQVARRRGEGETALPEGDQWLRPATPRT